MAMVTKCHAYNSRHRITCDRPNHHEGLHEARIVAGNEKVVIVWDDDELQRSDSEPTKPGGSD